MCCGNSSEMENTIALRHRSAFTCTILQLDIKHLHALYVSYNNLFKMYFQETCSTLWANGFLKLFF